MQRVYNMSWTIINHRVYSRLFCGSVKLGSKEEPVETRDKHKKLTNLQKIKLIEETLEREIRPSLKADGGDIELVDIDGNNVYVGLRGACSSCPSSEFTIKNYVEEKLREFVTPEIEVKDVSA